MSSPSPSKRRRLSAPADAVATDADAAADTAPANAAATDAATDADAATEADASTDRPPARTTPSRASWASPTKASLARFNPGLLPRPRPRAPGPGSPVRDGSPFKPTREVRRSPVPRGEDERAEDERAGEDEGPEGRESRSERRDGHSPGDPGSSPTRPPRRSAAAASTRRATLSPTPRSGSLGGGFALGARRRSSRGGDRASDPPRARTPTAAPEAVAAQLAGELTASAADGTAPQAARRSPPASGSALSARPRRPPSMRRSVEPAASSQPSAARARVARRVAEPELPPTPEQLGLRPRPAQPLGLLSSSPTARAAKRKPLAQLGRETSPLKGRNPSAGTMGGAVGKAGGGGTVGTADQENEGVAVAAPLKETVVELETAETLQKRDTLRRLQEQLQLIRDDVGYLERAARSVQETGGLGLVPETKIVALLTSADPNHERPFQQPKVLPLSQHLAQFLPFSRPARHQATTAALDALDDAALADAYAPVDAEPLAHCLGIEPRLAITARSAIVPASLAGSGALQTTRTWSLQYSRALLSMELTATIDHASDTLALLSSDALSPWARPELQPWLAATCAAHDLPALGRGLAQYGALAVLRAQTWARCCVDFAPLLHDPAPHRTDPADDEDDRSTKRSTLQPHLGRRVLQFSKGGASLLVRWEIALDWAGSAQSSVAASVAVPAAWRDGDARRGSLGRVDEAFRRLVEERGVREAVGGMVEVVLGWTGEDEG